MGHLALFSTGNTTGFDVKDYTCPVGVAILDVVFVSAPLAVDRAQANSAAKIPAIGIVTAKPNSTTATIQSTGDVPGFTGLAPGAKYYLSTAAGGLVATTPPGTHGVDYVQLIGIAFSSTVLRLTIDPTPVRN